MTLRKVPFLAIAEVNPPRDERLRRVDASTAVSFIAMTDISESGDWLARRARLFSEVSTGYTNFIEDDILFAKITPCMENGKGVHVRGLLNGLGFGSTEFHVLRAKPGIAPRFVYHWAQSRRLRQAAEAAMTGSAGQQRVDAKFFSQFIIPLLGETEQLRIGAILDTLDDAIRTTEQLIVKLKQLKQGLVHDLLNRGIDTNGELRDSTSHPEQFKISPLGLLPSTWEIQRLDRVADITDPNPSHRNPAYVQQGFPFISTVEFVEPDSIEINTPRRVAETTVIEQEARCSFRPGSIAFSRKGTIGETRFLPRTTRFALLDSLCVITARGKASPVFVNECLRSAMLKRQIKNVTMGVALQQVSIGRVRALLLPVPEPEEQARIAEVIMLAGRRVTDAWSAAQKLRLLRNGLMDDLLTGRVRVTDLPDTLFS